MRTAFLSLFLVVGLFLEAEAKEKFLLTSNVPPGKYLHALKTSSESTLQFPNGRTSKLQNEQEQEIVQEYLPEKPDGTKSLRFHLAKYKVRQIIDGEQVFVDFDSERDENDPDAASLSNAMMEARFGFELDGDGTILSAVGFDEFSEKLGSLHSKKFPSSVEQLRLHFRKYMEDMVSNKRYYFSKEPVGVGDSWEYETTQHDTSRGPLLLKSTARFDSLEEKPGEAPVAVIKTVTKGKQEEPFSTVSRRGTLTNSDAVVRTETTSRWNVRNACLLSEESTITRTGKWAIQSFDPNTPKMSATIKETGKTQTTVKRLTE